MNNVLKSISDKSTKLSKQQKNINKRPGELKLQNGSNTSHHSGDALRGQYTGKKKKEITSF